MKYQIDQYNENNFVLKTDYGWVVGVYMCVLCAPLLIQYSHRDQTYILQPNLSKYAVFMNTLLCRGGYRCGVPRDCGCVHVWMVGV